MNGWIAKLGSDPYGHKFGGGGWNVFDPRPVAGGPTLLLSLNLHDPKLDGQISKSLRFLPICTYINCDVWIFRQSFKIYPASHEVELIERSSDFSNTLDGDLRYPNPLPEKPLFLRAMTENEYGIDNFWNACDSFLGGEAFLRILGPPLWLQESVEPKCVCERKQKYVCSVGYDVGYPTGFIDKRPFFIGEAGLYFFFCADCEILTVISQSS